MDKKGYTTESGGRQNGFALEPEIKVISEGESKKSLVIFSVIILSIILGFFYYLKNYWVTKKIKILINLLTFEKLIYINYWQFNGSIKCASNTYKCKS